MGEATDGPVLTDLTGRVAVVTGGAGGIGRAIVEAFVAEGMKVVIADIEAPALDKTVGELRDAGHDVTGVRTDVTSYESVEALADAVYDTYGAAHVLVNNAGVGPPSTKIWNTTPNDWRWAFSVNVFGVAHGIQAFVPRMIEAGEPGVIVNTSSPNGPIDVFASAAPYAATKAAVTVLTEALGAQLVEDGTQLRAAVFYPSGEGLLDTGMWTSDRNRPEELSRERPRDTPAITLAGLREMTEKAGGELKIQPLDELADLVVAGIKDGRFIMIMPSPRTEETLRGRLDKVLGLQNPTTAGRTL